ncbi:hypothetical protein [Marinovum sp.]|uniref:hypothetical protein n=1 Tax=Marinovum sp. TaxID=2024839 RepID=UPI002B2794D0|nr:hypothetical protein [Marinovum sp.]
MDSDLALIVGIALLILAIPSFLSAFSEGRTPRVAALVVVLAGGLMVFAFASRPGGYRLDEVPEVFYAVVGRFL